MKYLMHGVAICGMLLAVGCGTESSNPSNANPNRTVPYSASKPITDTPSTNPDINPGGPADHNPIDHSSTTNPAGTSDHTPPVILPPITTPSTTPSTTTPDRTPPLTTTTIPDSSTPRSEK
jgi:hypothetical protein